MSVESRVLVQFISRRATSGPKRSTCPGLLLQVLWISTTCGRCTAQKTSDPPLPLATSPPFEFSLLVYGRLYMSVVASKRASDARSRPDKRLICPGSVCYLPSSNMPLNNRWIKPSHALDHHRLQCFCAISHRSRRTLPCTV